MDNKIISEEIEKMKAKIESFEKPWKESVNEEQ